MNQAQKSNALITYYVELYKTKYGRVPEINRNRDKWGFSDMITDIGYELSYKVLDYYFETSRPGHTLQSLFKNYDNINKRRLEKIEDAAKRAEIMRRTKQVVEEEDARRARANNLNMQE